MHIVTDSGADLSLTPDEISELNIHVIPLYVTLDGKTYREDIDIKPDEFYQLLEASENLPTTSQPSAGDFAGLYSKLAETDPDILSIHISSGLSGTYNAARNGADMVPEANITLVDTKTLSAVTGWQVAAAARAVKQGLSKEQILDMIQHIGDASESIYTLDELKYLIHGGRISHMRGLIASILHIKPLIGVEKVNGTYEQMGQMRTFKKAVRGLVDLMSRQHEDGARLHVQVLHSFNPDGAELLRDEIERRFDCTWLPVGPMSLVLGAHTGPSMIGVAYGPQSVWDDLTF